MTTMPSLPPTSYAILGVLSFRDEMSGYDVRKYADASIAWFYWSPAPSQIYAELRRLRDVGLVDERRDPADDRRNKRRYRLTDAGRQALADWIARSPTDPPVTKHPVMLRLWAGHNLPDPDTLARVLDEYERWCRDVLDHLQFMRERSTEVEEWRYPAVVARWGVRHYEAELENIQAVRADLANLHPKTQGTSPSAVRPRDVEGSRLRCGPPTSRCRPTV